jgi:hypothetical protein
MKTTTRLMTCLFAPAILMLAAGCKSKKVEAAPPPPVVESRNVFVGSWEGKDSNGNIYKLRFTINLQWESYIEEAGAERPHYKGTYQPDGSRARMTTTEEADFTSMGWRPERGNLPKNIVATVSGNTLKLPNVLTDAELRRR